MVLCNRLESYIKRGFKNLPFIYVVGEADYKALLSELGRRGLEHKGISEFCVSDDKFPSIDDVLDDLKCDTVQPQSSFFTGLGEFLAIKGHEFVERNLSGLLKAELGQNRRVVLLLRCVSSAVRELIKQDIRLKERCFIEEDAVSDLSITCVRTLTRPGTAKGIRGLLKEFESGAVSVRVKTELVFTDSFLRIKYMDSPFSAIADMMPDFSALEEWGTSCQWKELENELEKASLSEVFERHGVNKNSIRKIHDFCSGTEYRDWLFFLYLKLHQKDIDNAYLRNVLSNTETCEDLKKNILNTIIHIPKDEKHYWSMYEERKELVKDFSEGDIISFIKENDVVAKESIYRLTDNTLKEKEQILRWISGNGYDAQTIERVYPALAQYLSEYVFNCGNSENLKHCAKELTYYFKEYRRLKVLNKLTPEFLGLVDKYANENLYTILESRDSAIMTLSQDKNNTFLYWIDALGVEYLAYISKLARKKGLSIHVDITRAWLPTITSKNKAFFDEWNCCSKKEEDVKFKESALDEIKHKGSGKSVFDYTKDNTPIHLASELEVIEEALETAHTYLENHKCKSFVIASDHGASRLAVICKQEAKYDTDTKGEHSGRCCKKFPGADLPYAKEEEDWLVLANYGRFKKSRAANVEVHGGASLEEVIVPIITLKLRQGDVDIRLIDGDNIRPDKEKGTTFEIYISYVENSNKICAIVNGERYVAAPKDKTHYSVTLPKQKRSSKNDIVADIYDGDDFIGTLSFKIKGKLGAAEKDDLFAF